MRLQIVALHEIMDAYGQEDVLAGFARIGLEKTHHPMAHRRAPRGQDLSLPEPAPHRILRLRAASYAAYDAGPGRISRRTAGEAYRSGRDSPPSKPFRVAQDRRR